MSEKNAKKIPQKKRHHEISLFTNIDEEDALQMILGIPPPPARLPFWVKPSWNFQPLLNIKNTYSRYFSLNIPFTKI